MTGAPVAGERCPARAARRALRLSAPAIHARLTGIEPR